MAAEALLPPTLSAAPAPATRRRLIEALEPGSRRLVGSLSTLAVGANAAGIFAVASVAQDLLDRLFDRVGLSRSLKPPGLTTSLPANRRSR